MERNLENLSFQLEQSEKKIALIDEKLTFLNKLLLVVSVFMHFQQALSNVVNSSNEIGFFSMIGHVCILDSILMQFPEN